jgi:pyruvate/2-oxoglutarate dehydrogenase complex dihydrolipoamide acyltransferase (E2) component
MIDEPQEGSADAEKGYDLVSVGSEWKTKLEESTRYFESYFKRCAAIEKIYLGQKNDAASKDTRFAMLWANISVLQPAVYARTPEPAVERRFKDSDPVARTASEMTERVLTYQMETADIDSLLRQVRDDFLLFGRGAAWLRYEADIESSDVGVETTETEQLEAKEAAQLEPQERITGERTPVDYVHWSDFLHSPARRWEDVTWVARRVPMSKDDIIERFGEEAYDKISSQIIDSNKGKTDADRAQSAGKTGIWEIWCKTEKYVVWTAEGAHEALEVSEPPLELEEFWPCPRPAYATTSTGSLIPVPDYAYYQAQCDEIDGLTKRIADLTDQLRLKIFYPAGDGSLGPAIEKAMSPNNNTIMVPISDWANFAEKGGGKAVVTLPIDEIQKVITACIENRKQLMDDVYQITGISDIVRGDSAASETATAQRIKTQWGSIRIRDRQAELARYARDVVRMAGEIVCDLFQGETLMLMSGIKLPTNAEKQQAQMAMQQFQMVAQRAQMMGQQPPQPPMDPNQLQQMLQQPSIDDVVQLLRDDNIRGFRIDIETDSTIEPDEDAEKQRRMEFAQVLGGFIQQAGPIAAQEPMLVPVMGEVMLFVARGFRAGRQLEGSLEEMVQNLTQKAAQPPPPPQPSPDEQIKLQTTQVKAQAEQQKAQMSVQQAALEHHTALQQSSMEHHQTMQQTRQQAEADALNHHQQMTQIAAKAEADKQAHALRLQQMQKQSQQGQSQ